MARPSAAAGGRDAPQSAQLGAEVTRARLRETVRDAALFGRQRLDEAGALETCDRPVESPRTESATAHVAAMS